MFNGWIKHSNPIMYFLVNWVYVYIKDHLMNLLDFQD